MSQAAIGVHSYPYHLKNKLKKNKLLKNKFFAISVCRLRERGRMSKSVYVRVVHDLELLCSSLCDRRQL